MLSTLHVASDAHPRLARRGEDCEGLQLLELNFEQQSHVSKEARNTPTPFMRCLFTIVTVVERLPSGLQDCLHPSSSL